jgi:hypothetical protein
VALEWLCPLSGHGLKADDRLVHSFVPDPNRPPDLEVVKEACLVVDVLGPDYR